MKLGLGLLTAFFSVALVMPFLEAQDEPKKSDEKKTDEKKVGEKKKIVRVDESVILAIRPEKGKIQSVKDDEDSKEVYVVLMNPEKAAHFQKWSVAEQLAIAKTGGQQRLDRLRKYKDAIPKLFDDIFEGGQQRVFIIKDSTRFRTSYPPPLFDAAGNPKKLTPTQLSQLKGGSRLPGYPTTISALRTGQIVDVYVARPGPMPKQPAQVPGKKIGLIGADPNLNIAAPGQTKGDALLVYVVSDVQ